MKKLLTVAINVNAEVLLIDEILAVGDVSFQKKCFQRLMEIKEDGVLRLQNRKIVTGFRKAAAITVLPVLLDKIHIKVNLDPVIGQTRQRIPREGSDAIRHRRSENRI